MNLKLEFEFSKADILKEVDELKKQIDAMRPLPADVEGRVMQKLRLDWNYHSNAIEGNRLNYGETVAFLMEGITAKGKPLKDHLDIRGHNEAINFLLEIVKDTRPISEVDIRALHKMILVEPYDSPAQTSDGISTTKRITLGEYKTSPNHVKTATGEIHYYATPEETPAKMQELMQWLEEVERNKEIHPVVKAALFHHKFVAIHPFDDGNGRISRILMNLILMINGYPPVIIKMDDRTNYYSLLSRADNSDSWPFVEYIVECLKHSLQLYLRAANGDNIDEEDDIDKDIALFKLNVLNEVTVEEKKSKKLIYNILKEQIWPLFIKTNIKIQKFEELFFKLTVLVGDRGQGDKWKFKPIDEFFNKNINKPDDQALEDYSSVSMVFYFEKFRNAENDFGLNIWLSVEFDEYYYNILDTRDEIIFNKFYHEKLSKNDEKVILKSVVDSLKTMIDDKIKKPEI